MNTRSPLLILFLGFILVFLGFLAPFLMVMRVIPSSFLLNFLSYAASVAGVIMGMIGTAYTMRRRK